ncbi:hypothetical protein FRC00_013173, partial [Tulasnella sp. 408]
LVSSTNLTTIVQAPNPSLNPYFMRMTAQSIDQARQRYSQELARHTKMQWHLAQSEAAQRRQQEGGAQSGAAGANSKAGSVGSNGRAAGSQDQNHEPTAAPSSSTTQPDPRSSLKVIDFADPSHQL